MDTPDTTDPRTLFVQAFSADFLERLVMSVLDGTRIAFEDVNARFPGPKKYRIRKFKSYEAFYTFPHERKAQVDRLVREVADHEGVFSKPELNNGGMCPHSLIAHGSFILTPHHVRDRTEIVRPAEYRKSYFRNPETQLFLAGIEDWEDEGPQAPNIEDPMYAFLIYGGTVNGDDRNPEFADIVFPINDCKAYHFDRIELFKVFAEVVGHKRSFLAGPKQEKIQDQELKLRKQHRKKG